MNCEKPLSVNAATLKIRGGSETLIVEKQIENELSDDNGNS